MNGSVRGEPPAGELSAGEPRWVLVIPYKGAPEGKSRLADGFAEPERAELARAFLRDVLRAAGAVPGIVRILVVSNSATDAGAVAGPGSAGGPTAVPGPGPAGGPTAAAGPGSAGDAGAKVFSGWRAAPAADVEVVPDPGGGLNAAVRAGAEAARRRDRGAWLAVLTGDLPLLTSADLTTGLHLAADHERAVVPDAAGTGTTMLSAAPGLTLDPHFGVGSLAAHESLGHARLELPQSSTLRFDVDTPADLERAAARAELGPATREALRQKALR